MSNTHLELLLVECERALLNLNVKDDGPNGESYRTYLKVKGQLENKCATCNKLMDVHNCCLMDIEGNKMYHPGCAPERYRKPKQDLTQQEKILRLIEESKEMDDSAKMDLVLELIWKLMAK